MNSVTDLHLIAQAQCVPNALANAGDEFLIRRSIRESERRAAHAVRVAEYNAQARRVNGAKYQVINTATLRALPGEAMPYSFAKHVRDTHDTFNSGAYLVKRVG